MIVPQQGPRLLGSAVSEYSVSFDAQRFSETSARDLGINVPGSLQRALHKRKAEYVAGRLCARRAILAIRPAFDGQIGSFADRSPIWPQGIVGSLTHCEGFASAAVASDELVRGIGIDSGRIMDEGTAGSVERFITCGESWISGASEFSPAVSLTLLFSAKESLFKCLYPLVRRFFSFEHARIDLVDRSRCVFRAVLLVDIGGGLTASTALDGRYKVGHRYVHTGLMLTADVAASCHKNRKEHHAISAY